MTTARVLELLADPTMRSGGEIARVCGVSRQRVFQIRDRVGVERFHSRPPPRCPDCGAPAKSGQRCEPCQRSQRLTRWYAKRIILLCEVCGHYFPRRQAVHANRLKRGAKHIFCGRHCQGVHMDHSRNTVWVQRTCETCEKVFPISQSDIARGRPGRFCTRPCYEAWSNRKRKERTNA